MTKAKSIALVGDKISPTQLELVTRSVAKGATPDELMIFMHIAKKCGLDPFKKEIYYYKDNKGNGIVVTSRDGFLSIAQQSGEFRGIESAAVYEKDDFKIDYSTQTVHHIAGIVDRGIIVGAWAKTHRENCTPNITFVRFETYNKGFNAWKTHPEAMIIKCAEAISLKKTYGIGGITSMEEMGYEPSQSPETPPLDTSKAFDDLYHKLTLVKPEKAISMVEKVLKTPPFELTTEQEAKLKELLLNSSTLPIVLDKTHNELFKKNDAEVKNA